MVKKSIAIAISGEENTLPLIECISNPDYPPVALIILGVPGTGKSIVATNLAKLLRIYSVINTDYIREVLRYKSDALSDPFLLVSSFNAWSRLGGATDENIIKGWNFSRDAITGAIKHLMNIEFDRKRDFIVEGTLAPKRDLSFSSKGYCVHVLLTVSDIDERKRRLEIKANESRGKKMDRWFTALDVTQRIQTYLLQEAKQNNYIVIENTSLFTTINKIKNIPIPIPRVNHLMSKRGICE